ncbi:MAG TPA: type II secretion system minor pseudopilin GspK [Albitalea sp.]|nr:type II secretion system minor pseudopilin GspK [Albitalea sp.]
MRRALPRLRQRGAALLTAMIIVALVSTLAASMVWQQWRAVQVEVAERARLQSAWILSGALDWAKLILREDAKSGRPTALTEPWATPLAEARLSTFLAADKDNTDDGPEAFLSGSIVDAQSRYNLRNLVETSNNGTKVSAVELEALRQLFQAIDLTPDTADRIATGLKDALAPPGSPGASNNPPLLPQSVTQLSWLGIDAASIRTMTPYVVLLPVPTPVNLNTAPKEVLLAAIPGLDLGTAQRLVQVRQRTPFKEVADAQAQLPPTLTINAQRANIRSSFFEVRGRLRLSDRVLEESSLVERRGLDVVTLTRQRESSRESSG